LRRTLSVGFADYGPLLGTSIPTGTMVCLAGLFCILPGVMLWLRWMLCIPAVVVEGKRGGAARDRSEALTAGHRAGLFGMVVITVVLGGLVGLAFGTKDSLLHRFFARVVLMSVSGTFMAVLYAVTYFQLRSEKEGLDIDQLATVFE
jgi:hypothetical protein